LPPRPLPSEPSPERKRYDDNDDIVDF